MNPLYQMFGGLNNSQQKPMSFIDFAKQFTKSGDRSPQAIGMQLLNSGQMTQEQFNKFASIANMLTGRK